MTIAEEYKKGLTHARRVAGYYKRFGADYGDLLVPVKNPTKASIRRLQDIERQIRVIGERAQKEEEFNELKEEVELLRDNFLNSLNKIANEGRRKSTRIMVESSQAFITMAIEEAINDAINKGSVYLLKNIRDAFEAVSSELKGTLDRLKNAIYDDELNDPTSNKEQHTRRYINLLNEMLSKLMFTKRYNISDIPWMMT